MTLHDAPPARPNAAWISRYATSLLHSTPGLQPLDAVRLALNASAAAGSERSRSSNPAAQPGAGPR